ncbi:hypothetical protein [Sphingobium sp.]|uniref:hypothetical protein n=1 Tax=Sphingobium sp. TaxID=1912891 RepID=UPI0028BD8702|nr:hypothetical protein [Sphingobium sp.]
MAIYFASANDDLRAINTTMDEKAINRSTGSAGRGTFYAEVCCGSPCALRHIYP